MSPEMRVVLAVVGFALFATVLYQIEKRAKEREALRRIANGEQWPPAPLKVPPPPRIPSRPPVSKTQQDPPQADSSQGDFLMSMIVGQVTDNAAMGYLAGGSLTGAVIGSAIGDTEKPMDSPSQCDSSSSNYDYGASSCDSGSSSSFDSGSSSFDSGESSW